MGLLDWAKKLKDDILNGAGVIGDAIIPGDQSSWHHQTPPPAPTPAAPQRSAAAAIGASAGFGGSNPAQPYSAPTPVAQPPVAPIFKLAPPPPIEAPKTNIPLETVKQAVGGSLKSIGDFGADVAHGIADIAPRIAVQGASIVDPNHDYSFQAQDPVRKFIFGDQKIEPYVTAGGADANGGQANQFGQWLKDQGIGDTTANAAMVPAAGALAALDLFSGGKGKATAEAIAKAATTKEVEKLLVGHLGKSAAQIPADVIKQLVATTNPKEINTILSGHVAAPGSAITTTAEDVMKHYRASADAPEAEKAALKSILDDPQAAMQRYDERVMAEFGTKAPNIVAGDEAKYSIPGFDSTKSGSYHEPASALAKVKYDQLLADSTTKDKPVLLMAGGSGAGKTTGLKVLGKNLDDYAAVIDTNSNKLNSAASKIDQALKSGRQVDITYVYRDPLDAFQNGVVPRGITRGRIVPVDTHIDTHFNSLKVIHDLEKKYAGNPNVEINVIDNSLGRGKQAVSTLAKLPKSSYNEGSIKPLLERIVNDHPQITPEERQAYLNAAEARPDARPAHSAENGRGNAQAQVAAEVPALAKTATDEELIQLADSNPELVAQISQYRQEHSLPNQGTTATIDKERKFVTGVKNSPEVSPEVQKLVEGDYTPKSNKDLAARAVTRAADPKEADLFVTQKMTDKNADEIVATAIERAKQLDFAGEHEAASSMYDALAEKLTGLGRGVQAASLLARRTPEGQLYHAQRLFKKYGVTPSPEVQAQLREAVKAMKTAATERDLKKALFKVREIVSENLPASRTDQLTSIWKAGLLSAVTTLEGAGVGNVVKTGANVARDVLASGIDATITNPLMRMFGKGNVRSNTLAGSISGRAQGLAEGAKHAGEYLATGFDERNINETRDAVPATFKKSGIGWLGRAYQNTVFRPLGAVDQPFFYGELRKSVKEQAYLAAKNQKIKGADRAQFVHDFIMDPPAAAISRAQQEAEDATFTNPTILGKVAAAAKRAAGDNPAGKAFAELILPFARIPSAVATAVVTYSPVGVVAEVVKQAAKKELDPRTLNRAIADSTIGTGGAMTLGAVLYNSGNFTLATPTDATEKQLWEQEGKKPYSVRVGDKWISLNYIQPFGSLMAMGAAYSQAKKDNKPLTGAVAASAAAGGQAVTQQSFLKGVAGAIAALSTPERSAQQFVENTAGSVVPNFVKRIAAAGDTNSDGQVIQRDPKGIVQAIQSGIPGQRQNLPAKIGANGEELTTGQGSIGTIADPFRASEVKGGDVTTELRRLQDAGQGIAQTPQDAAITLGGKPVKLDQNQLNDYKTAVGQAVTGLWGTIMADPSYQSLSDADKSAALKRAKDAATSATNAVFARDNELGDPTKALSDASGVTASILAGTATPDMFTTDSKMYSQATKIQQLKDSYAADKAAGTLSAVEDFKRQKAITAAVNAAGDKTTAQIAANYSKDAVSLASLSKKDLATFVASGQVSQSLYNEMVQYKAALAAAQPSKAKKGRKASTRIAGGRSYHATKIKIAKVKAPKIGKFKGTSVKIAKAKATRVKIPKARLA